MKIISFTFKIILSFIIICYILYCNLIMSTETITDSTEGIYYFVSIVTVLLVIYLIIKKYPLYSFFIIIFLWITFIRIPSINRVFDKDYCLDSAICAEGLELNTEYGLIKINKENCLKYHWKWDDKSRYCNMRNDDK